MDSSAVTVLVVDDQEGVRQLLMEVLRSEGFNVTSCIKWI